MILGVHVASRDRIAADVQLGQVETHGGIQVKQALLSQAQDDQGGELLAAGGQVEDRSGCDRRATLQIGQAIAAGVDNLALPNHRQGAAGGVVPVVG